MLNILWPSFILISFIYALFTGNIEKLNSSIFEEISKSVSLTITFLGMMCLWNGLMKIVQKTTLIEIMTNMLKPLINFLFPEIKNNEKIKEKISMNMIANFLGLGNAATPIGIETMKMLQKENKKKDTITNTMAMFIVINTASMQLIPTTVIAIRNSLESRKVAAIIFPVWIATFCAAFAAILATKICIRIVKRRE